MIRTHRAVALSATALVVGVALLAGCSSSSSSASSASSSAAASASDTTSMLPPVIINNGDDAVTAKVGDTLDILVSDNQIAGTTVSVDKPELIEVTQAHEDEGGAIFNPGGKVLAPGVAVLTITYPDSSERKVTVTIAE